MQLLPADVTGELTPYFIVLSVFFALELLSGHFSTAGDGRATVSRKILPWAWIHVVSICLLALYAAFPQFALRDVACVVTAIVNVFFAILLVLKKLIAKP